MTDNPFSTVVDPNWQPFSPDSPSWLVFEDGGRTENESLVGFEEGMIDWSGRGKGKTGDEGEGDLLGVSLAVAVVRIATRATC